MLIEGFKVGRCLRECLGRGMKWLPKYSGLLRAWPQTAGAMSRNTLRKDLLTGSNLLNKSMAMRPPDCDMVGYL